MATWKYVNMTNRSISISGPRGGMVQFRPNQFTTMPWFSRWVKPGFLTRVAATSGDMKVVKKANRRLIKQKTATRLEHLKLDKNPRYEVEKDVTEVEPSDSMRRRVELVAEQETVHYKRIRGVFHCKHCDIFRCGGAEPMLAHLHAIHRIDLDEEAQKKAEDAKAQQPDIPPDEDDIPPADEPPVEEEDDVPDDSPETEDDDQDEPKDDDSGKEEETEPEKAQALPCPYCERMYTLPHWLEKHIREKHATEI